MVMVTSTDRMGSRFILPVRVFVTIDTILIFDGDFDRYSAGDVTYKRTLKPNILKTNLLYQNVDG